MKKITNIIKLIALYIWQLPQNLLGLILILYYQPQHTHHIDDVVVKYSSRMIGGISLGRYCLIDSYHYVADVNKVIDKDIVRHEVFGHTKQSKYLGPLYLLIIGIQSIIWAGLYGSVIKTTHNGYYKFWTESWADKLAGIKRV